MQMRNLSLTRITAVLGVAAAGTPACAVQVGEVYERVESAVVVVDTVQSQVLNELTEGRFRVTDFGSGVVVDSEGWVLTAAHVVDTADEIRVTFVNGARRTARVAASLPFSDVALLKLEDALPPGIQAAPLGDSDRVRVGDQIFVVGAPRGMAHSLSVGYISARRDKSLITGSSTAEFFQTDAAINPGNSGGPMFDLEGKVVGVVSHILSLGEGNEGLGFAATSNEALRLLDSQSRWWSGVHLVPVDGVLAEIFNVPPPGRGYLVERVARGSPGDRLGLRAGSVRTRFLGEEFVVGGDIVLEVMGLPATEENGEAIRAMILALGPAEEIRVKVLRRGEIRELVAPKQGDEDGDP